MTDNTNPATDSQIQQNSSNQSTQTVGTPTATTTDNTGSATAGNAGSVTAGNTGSATAGNTGSATADNTGSATAGNTGGATTDLSGVLPIPVDTTQAADMTTTDNTQLNNSIIEEATKKFDIPKVIREKHQELIVMVLQTKSMDDKERQYWFHILPVMNEPQIEKLRNILVNEKVKLAEIDAKYGKKMDSAQTAQVTQMDEEEMRQKAEELRQKEAEHEKEERAKEEALLAELANL